MRIHRPFRLLATVALATALCVSSGCGKGTDDEGEGAGAADEFDDALPETSTLLLTVDDTEEAEGALTQALEADSLFGKVRDSIGYANAVLHQVFDDLRALATAQNKVVERPNYRRWDGTRNGVDYQLHLARGLIVRRKFTYGLKARAAGTEDPYKLVLWGAFVVKAPRRGARRINFAFDRLKAIKGDDFAWDGRAHIRFLNHGGSRIVGVGVKNLVSPQNAEAMTGIAQYAKGPAGTRIYRFLTRQDLLGGEAREWFGARAVWHRGVGGVMQAILSGGDVAVDPPRHVLHACWDENLDPIRIDAEPDIADLTETGAVGDCVEEFLNVDVPPVDPDQPEAWESGGDYAIEDLPDDAADQEGNAADEGAGD